MFLIIHEAELGFLSLWLNAGKIQTALVTLFSFLRC